MREVQRAGVVGDDGGAACVERDEARQRRRPDDVDDRGLGERRADPVVAGTAGDDRRCRRGRPVPPPARRSARAASGAAGSLSPRCARRRGPARSAVRAATPRGARRRRRRASPAPGVAQRTAAWRSSVPVTSRTYSARNERPGTRPGRCARSPSQRRSVARTRAVSSLYRWSVWAVSTRSKLRPESSRHAPSTACILRARVPARIALSSTTRTSSTPSTARSSGATVAPASHATLAPASRWRSAVTIGRAMATSPIAASLTMRTEAGTGRGGRLPHGLIRGTAGAIWEARDVSVDSIVPMPAPRPGLAAEGAGRGGTPRRVRTVEGGVDRSRFRCIIAVFAHCAPATPKTAAEG